MNTSSIIVGAWAPVLLPINQEDRIDFIALADQLDLLLASGIHGVYSNGTASEFHNQTEAEFDRIHELMVERCQRKGMPFQIGICHPSPVVSLERLTRCLSFSPAAFQVILPDWVPTHPEEELCFLQQIGELAKNSSLILYNPPHAKRNLTHREIAGFKLKVPNLAGVKLADGGASWYASMRAHLGDLSVFIPGHHMATGVLSGAQGSYSNVAGLSPAATARWYKLIHSNPTAALRIEREILAFFDEHISPLVRAGYSNPALDKLLCVMGGWSNMTVRLRRPYRSIPDSVVEHLKSLTRSSLPHFFELLS